MWYVGWRGTRNILYVARRQPGRGRVLHRKLTLKSVAQVHAPNGAVGGGGWLRRQLAKPCRATGRPATCSDMCVLRSTSRLIHHSDVLRIGSRAIIISPICWSVPIDRLRRDPNRRHSFHPMIAGPDSSGVTPAWSGSIEISSSSD